MKTLVAVLKTLMGMNSDNTEALQILEREFSLGRSHCRSYSVRTYKF
jgi:hypothetical protein